MESKEERLLGGVIVNHLFLSQFEQFRACLLTLSERNAGLARDIYQAVIRKIWRLNGVVWSESVPSSSHLAWMCLQELHSMEEREEKGDGETGKWTSRDRAGASASESGDDHWRLHRRPIYDGIEFLLLVEFLRRYVVENGESLARQMTEGRTADTGSKAAGVEEGAAPSQNTAAHDTVREGQASADEVQRLGVQLIAKVSSAGVDRLDRSLRYVTGNGSKGDDSEDDTNNREGEGLRGEAAEIRDSSLESIRSSDGLSASLRGMDRSWVRILTLHQPDLLDALCQNIARQQQDGGLYPQLGNGGHHRFSAEEVDTDLDADNFGKAEGEEAVRESAVNEPASRNFEQFEIGISIQKEVQQAHLEQIMKDLEAGEVGKAIRHLQFLHEDFAVTEDECREAIHSILKEAKSMVREQQESLLLAVYECSVTSGSTLLSKLVESAQDNMLRVELEQSKALPEELSPPPLERLHQRLQQLRNGGPPAPQALPMTEMSAIRVCLKELFQYARVEEAHVLELVVEAALSSIKDRQLQRAADVVTLFPRLQPLVAVMGWDLLTGHTKSRRKMLELLWNSKAKSSFHGKATEEVSCVEQLCDQLCYRLELAYFIAGFNLGEERQGATKRIFTRGNQAIREENIQGPADPFVANLVLELLAMHSPVRVLFDIIPDIKLEEALELVKLQPTGTSASAQRQRHLDLELLHMHFGVQAAVLAVNSMQSSAEQDFKNEMQQKGAVSFLHELREHLEAITTPVRRVWMMNIIISLLHLDKLEVQPPITKDSPISVKAVIEPGDSQAEPKKSEKLSAITFIENILTMLQQCRPLPGLDLEPRSTSSRSGLSKRGSISSFGFPGKVGKKAWMKQAEHVDHFVDDWNWRLGVLQRLSPSYQLPWQWREALAVLRAAPSTLLNMCVQRNQYDLGEEAVLRFQLPPEESASLQLAQWVDNTVARASGDDAIVQVAEELTSTDEDLDFAALHAPLAPLSTVLLCIDVAATSVKTVDMARRLLNRACILLSQISQTGTKGQGPEQRQEAYISLVAKRMVLRLQELLEQETVGSLRMVLSGVDMVATSGTDSSRQVLRQRALAILQQTIEDATTGKRQFLSGKLHNLVKALADDEGDEWFTGSSGEKRLLLGPEHSLGLGLGLCVSSKQSTKNERSSSGSGSGDGSGDISTPMTAKGTMKRFLGPLTNKLMAYLSAFILYIATVGDIVDGVDTTHDFNFFTLIYERPNDLLTRLVFERGSADAAGKVAEIMGADLVHQVISACVPPIYPPRAGKGWACIPRLPTRMVLPAASQRGEVHIAPTTAPNLDETQLYPLQLDVVKHLATLSPVRTVLACVFGQSRFTTRAKDKKLGETSVPEDADRSFFEFALEQSEIYPTLNRWIQLQANLQSLSNSPMSSQRLTDNLEKGEDGKVSLKRPRAAEEADSSSDRDDTDELFGTSGSAAGGASESRGLVPKGNVSQGPEETKSSETTNSYTLMFDWENEAPYVEAVQKLMEEGKLVDALALADRWLRDGAPDQLLQRLIERVGESGSQSDGQRQGQSSSSHHHSSSWQYCIRLRNKSVAATLALKYLQCWELDAAIDVLTMCSCHLSVEDPLQLEVVRKRHTLQQYGRIQRADNRFTQWQEVESLCQSDPEGLALRLAGKGAVSAALDVAESFKLSNDLRRELQGRQLVKLLTTDPISGGGPAGGLRFLNSLHQPEDALPVAMAAMEQLPNLQSKQLLVHFFLKRRVGTLTEEEHARLDRLALGLRMLGALPLPWQQRCSALHEHPRLILETLLMGKQLRAASQLLQAFPSLLDDDLVTVYAAKALSVNTAQPLERRSSASPLPVSKPSARIAPTPRSNFSTGLNSLQKRAFSWTQRDTGNKIISQDSSSRKRKLVGTLAPSQKAAWEALAGVPEERPPIGLASLEGYERPAPMTMTEEWVLTGDPTKDEAVRASHKYESAPSVILFKALLELCSTETVAAKVAVDVCIVQIKRVLSVEQLPPAAFNESAERAFHATETFVQALLHARTQLKNLMGVAEQPPNTPTATDSDGHEGKEQASIATTSTTSPETSVGKDAQIKQINITEVLDQSEIWLNRVELLQSLLGAYVPVSLDDVVDNGTAEHLRDRLIADERYSMAVYTCTKCKIDAFPVWEAWGHSLLHIEHYAQARVTFKQCLRLHNGDPAPVVRKIIHAMEAGPPVDVNSARSLYVHMARSVSSSSDDSLSADSYLNVLYMPSFNKQDRSRRSSEDSADSHQTISLQTNGEESPPRSHLDDTRYEESVHYLQEYARQDLMQFMFQHCRYTEACCLFFPPDTLPLPPLPSPYQSQTPSSSPQRPDPLATDHGSLDELCDLCVAYGVVSTLERVIGTRDVDASNQDSPVAQHTASALTRICTYFENHRHFNHLYRFQVLKKDYVAAGLCCIQLFLNSSNQEQALRHLEHAKVHFDEGLLVRQQAGDGIKGATKAARGKLPSQKLTEEELIKFTARVAVQIDVVRTFGDSEGPPWKRSLFGNPNDADTIRRRCEVAEELVEKNFDLAFQIIYDFNLTAVHIYAGVAASLAERKKGHQLTELLRNIKGTIEDDDWDQVLGAAINVYANRHRERPTRLIDMLSSSHRKVLACVICGRLKSAFQIASRSESISDVQYVAHVARQSGSLAVEDLCKQWLASH